MGAWGTAAWQNDDAADWFADMFEDTGLAQRVVETLEGDPTENPEEKRAAAHLLITLGQTYIWPVDDLDNHLKLAIEVLEAIRTMYLEEEDAEMAEAVADDLTQLRMRLVPE